MFLVDYLWDSMVEFLYEVLVSNGEKKMKKFEMILKIRKVIDDKQLSKLEMISQIYNIINQAT
tara:strand:- start:77 stop:265 length:189 start_codon:yes stop_codon:yes gene_type:complete